MQAPTARQAMLELLVHLSGTVSNASARLAAHWDSLVPVLLANYGATLSSADQSSLRLLRTLNTAQRARHVPAQADDAQDYNQLQAWVTEGVAGVG